MTDRLSDIELCADPDCRQAVRHSGGPFTGNVQLRHIDERKGKIRLCLLCFLAYRVKYEQEGWRFDNQEKTQTL